MTPREAMIAAIDGKSVQWRYKGVTPTPEWREICQGSPADRVRYIEVCGDTAEFRLKPEPERLWRMVVQHDMQPWSVADRPFDTQQEALGYVAGDSRRRVFRLEVDPETGEVSVEMET